MDHNNNDNDTINKKKRKSTIKIEKRHYSNDKKYSLPLSYELDLFQKQVLASHDDNLLNIQSFEDVLAHNVHDYLTEINELSLQDDQRNVYWKIIKYCNIIMSILQPILSKGQFGSALEKMSKEWTFAKIFSRLDIVYKSMKTYRIKNYDFLYQYSSSGASKRWNLISQIFSTEAHLILCKYFLRIIVKQQIMDSKTRIIDHISTISNDELFDSFTPTVLNQLCNKSKIIAYGGKLKRHYFPSSHSPNKSTSAAASIHLFGKCLNQSELFISLKTMTEVWTECQFNDNIRIYLQLLLLEFIHLFLQPNDGRLDGKLLRDKTTIDNNNNNNNNNNDNTMKWKLSIDFISNVSTIFTYLERSLLTMKILHKQEGFHIINSKECIISLKMRQLFFEWLTHESKYLQAAKLSTKIKEFVFNLSIRSGEYEVYMRENNGIEAGDFTGIIELSKTTLQTVWWTTKLFEYGFQPFFEFKDEFILNSKNFIRDIIVLRMFHHYCVNNMGFDWWNFVIIHEHDFFKAETKLLVSQNPMIIICMGQFLVFYRSQIYIYYSSDQAILRWLFIMRTNHMNENGILFETITRGVFDLTRIYDLLEVGIKIHSF